MLERLLYLGYYLKKLDRERFWQYFEHARRRSGRPAPALLADVIASSVRHNISLLEYFQFEFECKGEGERAAYAGTGYMYEYQLLMNPRRHRAVLDDKLRFARAYAPFVRRRVVGIDELRRDQDLVGALLTNPSGKIVLKDAHGQCGWQVDIVECAGLEGRDLIAHMERSRRDLAEDYIVQHPVLMALSPTGVNTVRVVTQLDRNEQVVFLGARLRVSQGSHVDNMASGNFAAPIDLESGVVSGPGVYGDPSRPAVDRHPLSGAPVTGLQVPMWTEILDMARGAALHRPENRSIGWDIAVTPQGPDLIEGNHDWCKLVWQLPVRKGLKPVLEQHAREYSKRGDHTHPCQR